MVKEGDSGGAAPNTVTKIIEKAEATNKACRWVPDNPHLWSRVIYCGWMPNEGWIQQSGLYPLWVKPIGTSIPPIDNGK